MMSAFADSGQQRHTFRPSEPIVVSEVNTLVLSQGHDRVATLEAALDGFPGDVRVISDALVRRTAEEAVPDGLKVESPL